MRLNLCGSFLETNVGKFRNGKINEGNANPRVPFALPATLGHGLQGRVEAVGVVADVAVITQQESPWVRGLPASLAHRALQAPPALAQDHFSDLEKKQATRVTSTVTCASAGTIKHVTQRNVVLMQRRADKTHGTHMCWQPALSGPLDSARGQSNGQWYMF